MGHARLAPPAAATRPGWAEQQASSLEETATALNEITIAASSTAEGAQHAIDVVAVARDDAQQSIEIVRQAIDAMGKIEKSSSEIGQIIGVMAVDAFRQGMHDEVRVVFERPLDGWRGEGRVDDHREPRGMGCPPQTMTESGVRRATSSIVRSAFRTTWLEDATDASSPTGGFEVRHNCDRRLVLGLRR